MGLSMRMSEDQLTRDALAASATFYVATGGTNGDSPTNISVSDIDNVTTALLSNDAWMIFDKQEGEDRFGRVCAELKSALIEVEAEA